MSSIVLNPSGQPASPSEGEVYYDSSADKLKVRDASAFREVVTQDATFNGTIGSSATLPASRIRQMATSTLTSKPTRASSSFGAFSSAVTGTISGCLSSSKILIECHCTFSNTNDSIMAFHFYDVTNSAYVTPAGDDGHFCGSSTDSSGGRVSNGSMSVLYDPASYNSGSLVIELYGKGSAGTIRLNVRGSNDSYGRGTTVINLYEVTQ